MDSSSTEAPGRIVELGAHVDEVRGLVDKYERMQALRGALGRGTPSPEHRAALRSLSAAFPGALRELEQLATDEIDRRLQLVRAVDQTAPAWLLWTARYHARMRAVLAERTRSPLGRHNVRVFGELAVELGVPADLLWAALFPMTQRRAHREHD